MKFQTHNDNPAISDEQNGTHKQGTLNCHFSEIVAKFGPPEGYSADTNWDKMRGGWDDEDCDKVSFNWVIKFEDGTVATIHDWKDYCAPQHITSWSVGAIEKKAVENLSKVIRGVGFDRY